MRLLLLCCLTLCACPERKFPDRGVQLVYRKPSPEPVRATVDRRLARLKLKAQLQEDDQRLTVRLAEGADTSRLKALLATRARLDFCPEDEPIATTWCKAGGPRVEVDRADRTCALKGTTHADVVEALGDAGVPVAWSQDGLEAWALRESRCLAPRVVSAEPREGSMLLEFDRASAAEFSTLTGETRGLRLVIRYEGVVQLAPVVKEAITGGRATITIPPGAATDLELLSAMLVGGPLPELTLEKEGAWGPPSLR